METEIRYLRKEETEDMFKLASYAFNSDTSVEKRERFARLAEHSNNYGLFVEGKLASQVMCTPFEVNFHGQVYQMGGVGYVASYPEYRGQGKIRDIMRQMIFDMKNQNIALSYLAPFSYGFYRRFGYEQIFENVSYSLASSHLPKIKEVRGYVKRMKLKDAEPYLKDLYPKDEKNKKGGLTRSDWWWHYILTKSKNHDYAIFFDEKDVPQGYLVYERNQETFRVVEWIYLTFEAFKGLGKFISSHDSAFSNFVYTAPKNEYTIEFLVQEPESDVQVLPYMMGRIIDIELFLSQYPYLKVNGNHEFLLGVMDEYAPWNEGIWRFAIKEQKISIDKLTDDIHSKEFSSEKMITGDIQAFTQLFMGYRRPKTLAFYSRIKGDNEVLKTLEEIIPRGLPSIVDYF